MPIIFTQPQRVANNFIRKIPREYTKLRKKIRTEGRDKGYQIGYNQAIKDMKACVKISRKKKA